jgi:hypothetical protein
MIAPDQHHTWILPHAPKPDRTYTSHGRENSSFLSDQVCELEPDDSAADDEVLIAKQSISICTSVKNEVHKGHWSSIKRFRRKFWTSSHSESMRFLRTRSCEQGSGLFDQGLGSPHSG